MLAEPNSAPMDQKQYREIWIDKPDDQSLSALISGDLGFLIYFRYSGDAGFSSRNPDYRGDEGATIEYFLSNGQRDEHPAAWALPIFTVHRALDFFRMQARPPNFIKWHNDSRDGAEIEFVPG